MFDSGFDDIEIPLIECQHPIYVPWRDNTVKYYCPQFGKEHFLYGNIYTAKYSWMRLVLHFCDDTELGKEERIKAGKKHVECKSREEIIHYFANTLVGLDLVSESPNLLEDDPDKVI